MRALRALRFSLPLIGGIHQKIGLDQAMMKREGFEQEERCDMKPTILPGEVDGETNSPGLAQIRYSVIFHIPHYVVNGQLVNFHLKDLIITAMFLVYVN